MCVGISGCEDARFDDERGIYVYTREAAKMRIRSAREVNLLCEEECRWETYGVKRVRGVKSWCIMGGIISGGLWSDFNECVY